jgi:hypothetical protein
MQVERPVQIQTNRERLSGSLQSTPHQRTLDDLNVGSRQFIVLWESAREAGMPSPVAIAKSSILFVWEAGEPPAVPHESVGRFTRSSVQIRVGEFDIAGFIHVPPGGDVLQRVLGATHPFLSVTSASVVGPDGEFAAGFLAINMKHIETLRPLVAGIELGAK